MKVNLQNLKVGMTIYHVHAFTDDRAINNTWIDAYKVVKFPITVSTGHDNYVILDQLTDYCKLDYNNKKWIIKQYRQPTQCQSSMDDMAIIPNTYNNHATFSSLSEAKDYVSNLYNMNITNNNDAYDRAMKVLDV